MSENISPLTCAELTELMRSAPSLDAFGPNSNSPFVVVQTDGIDDQQTEWLRTLPCPVIGFGQSGEAQHGCDVLLEDAGDLELIARNIRAAPIASMVLVQHLRASETLSFEDALIAESFAYAALQQGPEFQAWRDGAEPPEPRKHVTGDVLGIAVEHEAMRLMLSDPDSHNAIGVTMRDALCEALDMALAQPDLKEIHLTGQARVFSTGGDVAEFGAVSDPATAHWIRSLRLPATRLAALRQRLSVHVNGAAIGAGAEIAAFGRRITADADAWFQLPELKYGLIPGAGGTVSLPRRIGRQRTAYLALSMKRINAQTALEWQLVDQLVS